MNFEDWLAVNNTLSRYAEILDSGDLEGLGDLFTDDAVFEDFPRQERSASYGFPGHGREGVVAALQKGLDYWLEGHGIRRTHLVANIRAKEVDPTSIEVTSQWLVIYFAADGSKRPEIRRTGHYEDVLVKSDDGRWRFKQRHSYRHNQFAK
jgi:3-phenylpropionate/cinnamic acid dioxygenase small subunit